MAARSSNRLFAFIFLILIAGGIFYFLYGKDKRTGGEKLGDAVDSLTETHSLKNAGNQLKDSTPAEKLGNAISDTAKQAEK